MATKCNGQTSQELDEMLIAAGRQDSFGTTVSVQERDGMPVVLLDIPKAFNNEDVKLAWEDVPQTFKTSNALLKVPNALIQAIQAIVRTLYEPVEETARYSTQSPVHALGTALGAYVVTAAATGDLDDHIDEIGDLFSSDSGSSDNNNRPTSELSKLEATEGGRISVSGAPAGPLEVTASGEDSRVDVDFQSFD
jgi:hypothetical protein